MQQQSEARTDGRQLAQRDALRAKVMACQVRVCVCGVFACPRVPARASVRARVPGRVRVWSMCGQRVVSVCVCMWLRVLLCVGCVCLFAGA